MQTLGEIVLPETKPGMEWIGDRAVQKVMPTLDHSILQAAFQRVLEDWSDANQRGIVVPEWRLRASPPGEVIHPLVPDVTFMSLARLLGLPISERQTPNVAPEIVVEVLSPDDRARDVDEKRRVYLAWGVELEIIADPDSLEVDFYDGGGSHQRAGSTTAAYIHKSFPDLIFPIRAIFSKLEVARRQRIM